MSAPVKADVEAMNQWSSRLPGLSEPAVWRLHDLLARRMFNACQEGRIRDAVAVEGKMEAVDAELRSRYPHIKFPEYEPPVYDDEAEWQRLMNL